MTADIAAALTRAWIVQAAGHGQARRYLEPAIKVPEGVHGKPLVKVETINARGRTLISSK